MTSSLVTTLLIPPAEFAKGGKAYGRALAYLSQNYLGDAYGTVYDLSTIAIFSDVTRRKAQKTAPELVNELEKIGTKS